MATATVQPLTNQEFADAVDIHHSMASRLRAGKRLPGIDLTERIAETYKIPLTQLLAARRKGEKAMGEFLRRRIFDKGLRPTRR